MQNWSPSSWRGKPIRHVPVYGHEAHLREVEKTIATYPPLVFAGEARDLKEKLALASQGKAFCSRVVTVLSPLLNIIQITLGIFLDYSYKCQLF